MGGAFKLGRLVGRVAVFAAWMGGAFAGWSGVARAQTPSLTLIAPPPGRTQTQVSAISADGRWVTGYTTDSGLARRGFTWSRETGIFEWGGLPGVPFPTLPSGISNDGLSVSGTLGSLTNEVQAFQVRNGVYQGLGTRPAPYTNATGTGISGDGQIIVGGLRDSATGRTSAMRWTAATGMVDVGRPIATNPGAALTGLSRDGSTAIGQSNSGTSGSDAYTWTESGGWRFLPPPPEITGTYDARPDVVNTNGSIVAGFVDPTGNAELRTLAAIWRDGVPTSLGTFGSRWDMFASGVNDDGSIVVGAARNLDTQRFSGVIWVNGSGPILFQDYLASLGVQVPPGAQVLGLGRTSADGSSILGVASLNGVQQGFVAVIPAPSVVIVASCSLAILVKRRRSRVSD